MHGYKFFTEIKQLEIQKILLYPIEKKLKIFLKYLNNSTYYKLYYNGRGDILGYLDSGYR